MHLEIFAVCATSQRNQLVDSQFVNTNWNRYAEACSLARNSNAICHLLVDTFLFNRIRFVFTNNEFVHFCGDYFLSLAWCWKFASKITCHYWIDQPIIFGVLPKTSKLRLHTQWHACDEVAMKISAMAWRWCENVADSPMPIFSAHTHGFSRARKVFHWGDEYAHECEFSRFGRFILRAKNVDAVTSKCVHVCAGVPANVVRWLSFPHGIRRSFLNCSCFSLRQYRLLFS